MKLSLLGVAAWMVAAPWWAGSVLAGEVRTLDLDTAFERVLERHPDLRVFAPRERGLVAERDEADLAPPLRVGIDLENALGTGELSGIGGAELGISLSSVFERGGKRQARIDLAQTRIGSLALQREARRLDLLAEVARRYLDWVAAGAEQVIAADDLAQREVTLAAAQRRVRAGASPRSVELAAEAALARARLSVAQADAGAVSSWQRLAILWGDADAGSDLDASPASAADPLALPAISSMVELRELLADSPNLGQFADEQRVREARLRLAQTQRTTDLDWQLGVRRLQSEGDWALMAGVSIPLGSARRAEPAIRGAQAELEALAMEREGSELALQATLLEAHGRYTNLALVVARHRDDILPALARAADAAGQAFRAGALSHLEWAQLQSDIVDARRQQLAAAVAASQALIEIQRLTAQPFILPTVPTPEISP